MALIVVDGRIVEAGIAVRSADKSAIDGAALLGNLVRVGEVELAAPPQRRAAQRSFPGTHQGAVYGDRDEDVGLADVRVIQEIVDSRLEVVDLQRPAAEGNLNAELVLFVALAAQHREARDRKST